MCGCYGIHHQRNITHLQYAHRIALDFRPRKFWSAGSSAHVQKTCRTMLQTCDINKKDLVSIHGILLIEKCNLLHVRKRTQNCSRVQTACPPGRHGLLLGSSDVVKLKSFLLSIPVLFDPFPVLTGCITKHLVVPSLQDQSAHHAVQMQGVSVAGLLQRVSMVTCTFVAQHCEDNVIGEYTRAHTHRLYRYTHTYYRYTPTHTHTLFQLIDTAVIA